MNSPTETQRLDALRRLGVLDTAPEPIFDAITAMAAQISGMPMALLSLIDAERQWFKSVLGLPGASETPREVAFCDHTIRDDALLEVPDARLDPRFATNPFVLGEPEVRFYAGAPIVLPGGERVGTVCVVDRVPGQLSAQQRTLLEGLAGMASAALVERSRFVDSLLRLQREEARQRGLYEATPALLHSIDAQGRLMSVSDLWLTELGYRRDEVLGRPSADFLAPHSAKAARDVVLPAFFRTGRCDDVDYQFVRKDGTLLDVRLSAILERDAGGAPLRSFAVLEDVSGAKRLREELGRTHAHLDALLDNVPALVGHWDRDGITRFANREVQAATGLPLGQIVGHSLQSIYDAVDPIAYLVLAPRVRAALDGKRQEFELPMLTTSGLRQLRMTLVPEQPESGRVDGFYGMAHDITGQKALELRLGDSEARYRSLFENLNSGFALHEVVCDAGGKAVDYRYLAMNAAFAQMTGLDPATAIGRRATELSPGADSVPAQWIGVLGQVALSGVPRHFEQHSAALDKWFDVVAYRAAPWQFAVIAQDITHRKHGEARLQDALHEKETLLKEVYHRVKNNLQVVQSLLTLQRRTVPDAPTRLALDETVQRVRSMALVHEKLYQSGNLAVLSLRDYTLDLLKQIGEAMGLGERRVRLTADVAPLSTGLDSAIPFGLLLTELVSNALKHGLRDRPGEIRVELVRAPGGALLSVVDDGVGLPADFDLARAGSMGLQLASNLARQLGGELVVAHGAGAGFKALLTRIAVDAASAPDGPNEPNGPNKPDMPAAATALPALPAFPASAPAAAVLAPS